MNFRTVAFILPTLMLATTANAANPVNIGQYDAWGAYSYRTGNVTTCYALSAPTEALPKNVDHGQNFFLVSRTAGKEVPQVLMGYPLRADSKIHVTVGTAAFDLFVKDQRGWVEDANLEPVLVRAMRGGQTMTVEATSMRGTATRYSYSLSGLTAALEKIKLCK